MMKLQHLVWRFIQFFFNFSPQGHFTGYAGADPLPLRQNKLVSRTPQSISVFHCERFHHTQYIFGLF